MERDFGRARSAPRRRAALAALGGLVLLSSAIDASGQARPSLRAQQVTEAIAVDGRLDEPAWAGAEAATDFLQYQPREGAAPSRATEVRVLYGPSSLYIGALLRDPEPEAIERTLGRRDEFNRADWFLVSLDSYLDRRTAYVFAVNAAGVQFDATQSGSGGGGPGGGGGGGGGSTPRGMDPSWDAIWASSARVTPEGWVVEIAIPYSMLRFPRSDSQTWGVKFARHLPRLGEEVEWPLVRRVERTNQVARFADLSGLDGVEPRRNVQLRPYTVARVQSTERVGQPGVAERGSELDVGGDVKVGLGPNVTLDLTLNPDFGQVEADPAVLNLTAFETVFEERRPFFVEGSQIYDFDAGPGRLLYTRRIGAAAPIVGAAKLSGRTAQGLSFGVLGASTGEDLRAERQYGAVRMSQQIGEYSNAGGILTAYDGPLSTEPGRRRSVVAGGDWDLRLMENRYGVEGFAAASSRWATVGAAGEETGFAAKLWGRKRSGAWTGFTGFDVFSDHFNPNDVGQLRFNDALVLLGSVEHQINGGQPFGPVQRGSASLFAVQRQGYRDRLNQGLELRLGSRWALRSFETVEASISVDRPFGGYDPYETRGLGPWAAPARVSIEGEFTTDERRNWEIEPELGLVFEEGGGRAYATGLRGNWLASSRVSVQGNVEFEWERGVQAWSGNESFLRSGDAWLIGRRSGRLSSVDPADYVPFADGGALSPLLAGVLPVRGGLYQLPVFGSRDTRAADATLRGTYSFQPNLSLQLYGQLFLAQGRYRDMALLTDRDRLDRFDAFPKRDEFALTSLQSNALLRWEFRPGSTVYAVWTHGRRAEDELNPLGPWGASPYDVTLGDRIGDTFELFPDNVFLIKISYAFLN